MSAVALRRLWPTLRLLSWPVVIGYLVGTVLWFYMARDDWTTRSFGDPFVDHRLRLSDITIWIGLPTVFAWSFLGRRYARLLLNAAPLQIPGLAGRLHCSAAVLAVATIAGTSLLGIGLTGFLAPALAVTCIAILFGLIFPLLPIINMIGAFGLQSLMHSVLTARPDAPSFLAITWSLAGLLALLWILQLRRLVQLARAGAPSAVLRSLQSLPDGRRGTLQDFFPPLGARLRAVRQKLLVFAGSTGQRVHDRSPDGTIRVILGPSGGLSTLLWFFWAPLACSALLWFFWLVLEHDVDGQVEADWLMRVRGMSFDWGFLATTMTAALLMVPAQRVFELFRKPGGEISELALLPGLGGERVIRAALVRQAMLRPVMWLALAFCLGFGGSIAAQSLLGIPFADGWGTELLLVLPMAAVLLAGAMTVLAVLLGLFDQAGTWLVGLPLGAMMVLGFIFSQVRMWAIGNSVQGANPPIWVWIVWALILVGLAVGMRVLLARWSRRRHILSRTLG